MGWLLSTVGNWKGSSPHGPGMNTVAETELFTTSDPAVPDPVLAHPDALRPYVIVLFGATGDLSRRKLLPGLLRLSQSGLLPEYQIVGTSLEEMDDSEFHDFALKACREFARHDIVEDHWPTFRTRLHYVAQGGGADVAGRGRGAGRGPAERRSPTAPLPEHPTVSRTCRGENAGPGRPGRAVPDHHGEAVRHRPRVGQGAQRRRARRFLPRPGVPDRPLPGEGGGPEHPGLPLRQRSVRTHLEP